MEGTRVLIPFTSTSPSLNLKFTPSVPRAAFQVLSSHAWLVATMLDSADIKQLPSSWKVLLDHTFPVTRPPTQWVMEQKSRNWATQTGRLHWGKGPAVEDTEAFSTGRHIWEPPADTLIQAGRAQALSGWSQQPRRVGEGSKGRGRPRTHGCSATDLSKSACRVMIISCTSKPHSWSRRWDSAVHIEQRKPRAMSGGGRAV